MKLPQLTRLRKDDMGSGLPAWLDKVIYAFNRLADSVYTAFNNGLTMSDNMRAQVFVLKISTTDLPYRMASTRPVTDAWVTAIYEDSGSRVDFTTAVWVDWVYDASSSNFVVYNISGITVGKTYNIRIIGLSE